MVELAHYLWIHRFFSTNLPLQGQDRLIWVEHSKSKGQPNSNSKRWSGEETTLDKYLIVCWPLLHPMALFMWALFIPGEGDYFSKVL